MKTLTQVLVAVAVVGAASVAHADWSISGGSSIGDTAGSTLASPTFVGSTPVSGSSTFDIVVTSDGAVPTATLDVNETGVYEVGAGGGGSASSLLSLSSITITPLSGGASTPSGILSSATTWSGTLSTAGTYQAVVDWTLSGVFNPGPSWLSEFRINLASDLDTQGGDFTDTTQNMSSFISAVPEPSQAIAGITLLGCGGLVMIGRRLIVKKA